MSESDVPLEIEAKLLVPRVADQRAILHLTQIGPYALVRRDVVRLHSQYLDTADFALVRNGVTLRLRRHGTRWEATAKWVGTVKGELHERPELNVSLPGRPTLPFVLPEGELRTRLFAIVSGRALQPILVSEIRRQRFDVMRLGSPEDAPLGEMALDRIRLIDPNREAASAAAYCELEIESLRGERRDVATVARLLQRRFDLPASSETKFSSGMKLVYGTHVLEPPQTRLAAGDTLAAAVQKITTFHLGRVRASDPGARLGKDPEALHAMRVAVRRLRAVLRAFPEAFSKATERLLVEELRWLGGVLGVVRDLDVQLERLHKDRTAAPPRHRAALDGLQRYLEEQRKTQRVEMIKALESARYLALLLRLEEHGRRPAHLPRTAPGLQPAATAGCQAFRRAIKRLMKRGDKVRKAPTPEDLHALRIRAKRVRYLLEFFADLTDKAGAQLVERLVELQDLLGSYHDSMVAADVVQQYVDAHGAQEKPGTLLALGALVGNHLRAAEDARTGFASTWAKFRRKKVRRLVHAVLRKLDELGAPGKHQDGPAPPRRRALTGKSR